MNQSFEQVGLKRILLSIISQSVNLKAFNHFQSLHSPSSVPSVSFSPCTVNIFSIHHMICLEEGGGVFNWMNKILDCWGRGLKGQGVLKGIKLNKHKLLRNYPIYWKQWISLTKTKQTDTCVMTLTTIHYYSILKLCINNYYSINKLITSNIMNYK